MYRSGVGGAQLLANPELVALDGYHGEEDMLRSVGDVASDCDLRPKFLPACAESLGLNL